MICVVCGKPGATPTIIKPENEDPYTVGLHDDCYEDD